jgi:hypothetical protein
VHCFEAQKCALHSFSAKNLARKLRSPPPRTVLEHLPPPKLRNHQNGAKIVGTILDFA